MISNSDVSDDESFVDLYAVVEGRARLKPQRPSKYEVMNEEKLAPNRTNSRTTHDRSSNDICHSDSLAVKETRRFEKSRNVDAPSSDQIKYEA